MSEPALAGFELIEKIGQGGMGVVWKARQLSLDRIVAVKLLAPALSRDPENMQAIMKEARIAAKLKHPGIVQVYDAGTQNEQCYFVMEYVDGYSVGEWLLRKRLISPREALLVAEHVAVALDYAWQSAGIIHCDIKPENIMVDQDGSIKVADLGLSRTFDSRNMETEEILGTPSFMSPEQVRGDVPLDCRTDIYSLGATLYNMVTGHRLFQRFTGREIMEQQIAGTVGDPREIVPSLSLGVCRLLESMLAKDRDLRPSNWITVLNDIRRMQKGLPVAGKAMPAGASTLKVENREARAPAGPMPPKKEKKGGARFLKWVGLAVIVLTLGGVGWYVWQNYGSRQTPDTGGTGSTAVRPGGRELPAGTGGEASEAYSAVLRWIGENPEDTDGALQKLQTILRLYPGSGEAQWAIQDIRRLREEASAAGGPFWTRIQADAEALRSQGKAEEAVRFLEMYTGVGATQTVSNRMALARRFRAELASGQLAKLADRQWQALLQSLADGMLSGLVPQARETVREAIDGGQFAAHREDLDAIDRLLGGFAKADDKIIESFKADVGKVIRLRIGQGTLQVKVLGLEDGKLRCMAVEERTEILLGGAELASAERLARLGAAETPELALVKGLLLAQSRSFDEALACFLRVGEPLGPLLVQRLKSVAGQALADPAETALRGALAAAGITVGPYSATGWLDAVKSARLDGAAAETLSAERERYLVKFGGTEFGLKAAPVLLEVERICEEARERASVPAAAGRQEPGEGQEPPAVAGTAPEAAPVDPMEVALALLAGNPDITPDMVTVAVTDDGENEVRIKSKQIRDLSPLGRLTGIGALVLESGETPPVPIDLRPLRGTTITSLRLKNYVPKDHACLAGLKLKRLFMPDVALTSYASIEGMPLSEIDLSGSNVKDLGFVRGMKLQVVRMDNTKLTSISGLAGMPLRILSLANTGVRDLSVLRGRPLEYLNLSGTPVYDFQNLHSCSIGELVLKGMQVRDISFVSRMKIGALDLGETSPQDLSPLRGSKVSRLSLRKAQLRDLDGLKGMGLKGLDVSGVRVPIQGMVEVLKTMTELESLDVSDTEISRLDFLSGSKIRDLVIARSRVKDLSPLAGTGIRSLDCRGCAIEDYTILKKLPVETLSCDVDIAKYKDFFLTIPTLWMVNNVPIGNRRPASKAAAAQ